MKNIRDRRKEDSSPSETMGLDCRITHSEQSTPIPGYVTGLDQSRKEVQNQKKNQTPSASSSTKLLSARTTCRIGTWNVQTLYQPGKLAQLLREFETYQLDILGISEMRWTGRAEVV